MRAIAIATYNETRKGILLAFAYKADLLFGLVLLGMTFVGLVFVVGGGKPSPELIASTLIGYLLWDYVVLIGENMGDNFISETTTGTLEQMFISPIPIGFMLIGRVLATLTLSLVQLALVGSVLSFVFRLQFH